MDQLNLLNGGKDKKKLPRLIAAVACPIMTSNLTRNQTTNQASVEVKRTKAGKVRGRKLTTLKNQVS